MSHNCRSETLNFVYTAGAPEAHAWFHSNPKEQRYPSQDRSSKLNMIMNIVYKCYRLVSL